MFENSRRDFLKYTGAAVVAAGTTGTGVASAQDGGEESARRGRLRKLGRTLPEDPPRYNFGDVRPDGRYGAVSSFPRAGNIVASTLYDLSDLETPEQVHRLPPANELTRSNAIRFDALREGIYYRAQEPDDADADDPVGERGIEVVDYGYAEGTPEEPAVVAQLTTPNTGVHQLAVHPEQPVVYLVDETDDEPGVISVDTSDPTNPTIADQVGPGGYCHALEVDTVRNVLHTAFIAGDFVGYAILDLEIPLCPREISRVDYVDYPDYEEIGEPGFEACHQAGFDPERDLAIVGDEVGSGIPGGKHIFDIGWDEGSLEDPVHVGFTHAPNAEVQEEGESFFWTTHFHDVIPGSMTDSGTTLLVDGGYHEGTWLCDISDPRNPRPAEQYPTRDVEENRILPGHAPSHPPYCWSAMYNEERDFVFASDTKTGAYTFRVSDEPFEFRTVEEELVGGDNELDDDEVELAVHYYLDHASVPNTGGERMTRDALDDLLNRYEESNGRSDEEADGGR